MKGMQFENFSPLLKPNILAPALTLILDTVDSILSAFCVNVDILVVWLFTVPLRVLMVLVFVVT